VRSRIALGLACVAVACGLFALGRASADREGARDEGFSAGLSEGRAQGERAGRAAGVREGRALQAGAAVAGSVAPFRAGYAAGANDVFGGFDGGWSLDTPYVITLRRGSGGVTYRIDSRRPVVK
jgi:hypothetical protein